MSTYIGLTKLRNTWQCERTNMAMLRLHLQISVVIMLVHEVSVWLKDLLWQSLTVFYQACTWSKLPTTHTHRLYLVLLLTSLAERGSWRWARVWSLLCQRSQVAVERPHGFIWIQWVHHRSAGLHTIQSVFTFIHWLKELFTCNRQCTL